MPKTDKLTMQMLELVESHALFQLNYPFWGRHCLHIGSYIPTELFAKIAFYHHIPVRKAKQCASYCIQASALDLPFVDASIDVIYLQRVLEMHENPTRLLAEAHRVLNVHGVLLISGVNGQSLWRLYQMCHPQLKTQPWQGTFHSVAKVLRLLKRLGFSVQVTQTCLFGWPNKQQLLADIPYPNWENLARRIYPHGGALYTIVAKKDTLPLNPIIHPMKMPSLQPL